MAVNASRFRAAEARMWRSVGVADVVERTLTLSRTGASVRVQEVGSGPPVVLIHGVSTSGVSWADLVPHLMSGWRCILVDRPGCGLSPALTTSFADIDVFGAFGDAFVPDVLDALELERAAVVATSFGGYFAIRSASAAPSRFERLVLLGWSVGAPVRSLPLIMRMGGSKSLGRLTSAMPVSERMVRPMLKQIGLRAAVASGQVSDDFVATFHSLLRDTDTMRNEQRAGPQMIRPMRGFDARILHSAATLGAVDVPTLLLWGVDDPFGGPEQARTFAAAFPSASLELVPGGHAVWVDDPTAIGTRIAAFLT